MTPLAQPTNTALALTGYTPATGDLKALLDGMREGLSVWTRDLTPQRLAAAAQQLACTEAALQPADERVMLSWLHQLRDFVTNPPANDAAMKTSAIAQVCADLPVGVWTPQTRLAWARQPPRDGYPIGARWPSPAELYAHLTPFARRIRDEQISLRRLLTKAATPPERAWTPPSEAEKAHVRALAAQFRAEVEGRSR